MQHNVLMNYQIDQDKIIYSPIEDETLIVNVETGCYFSLNKFASYIWNLLLQRTSFESIITLILEKYDVSEKTAKKDLLNLFEDFQKEKIIHFERK
ncbi:PqqD family protein [Candidatus Margulisiibacteriota bacterium]